LPDLLGVKVKDSIVGTVEEISKRMDKIPSGMSKERFIELRVQESLSEEDGFDLLVMGRPEGPGCYCYVNNLLRDIMARVTKSYDFTVIDNAAGMEHISRRTMRNIDKLVLVSDYSAVGIRSAKKISDLAKELGIKVKDEFLVVNRMTGALDELEDEIKASGLKVAGAIPYSEELSRLNIADRPIFELKDKTLNKITGEIFSRLMKG
jgi:CO dehydrogenase maturation factor